MSQTPGSSSPDLIHPLLGLQAVGDTRGQSITVRGEGKRAWGSTRPPPVLGTQSLGAHPRRTRLGYVFTRKSDTFRPVRFWTTSPKPAIAWGGGGPPAPAGQSGNRRRAPGWLHWQAGDGDSGVQLPLARMLATSGGTSGTVK